MTLWNIIRDWFVQYVWGGATSNGSHFANNLIGDCFNVQEGGSTLTDTSNFMIKINAFNHISDSAIDYISIGDWFSTTSTIIVLVLLCAFLFLVVRYLFRLTSGLVRGH